MKHLISFIFLFIVIISDAESGRKISTRKPCGLINCPLITIKTPPVCAFRRVHRKFSIFKKFIKVYKTFPNSCALAMAIDCKEGWVFKHAGPCRKRCLPKRKKKPPIKIRPQKIKKPNKSKKPPKNNETPQIPEN